MIKHTEIERDAVRGGDCAAGICVRRGRGDLTKFRVYSDAFEGIARMLSRQSRPRICPISWRLKGEDTHS